jgi:hypothetical protein
VGLGLPAATLLRLGAMLLGVLALSPPSDAAEHIKIGLLRVPASGPIYIAVEKGYFGAEGIDPELVYFESGPPIPTGIVSGDLDFGDADARLDIKDVLHQIEWYRAQGLIKGEVDGSKIIDRRYVRNLSP